MINNLSFSSHLVFLTLEKYESKALKILKIKLHANSIDFFLKKRPLGVGDERKFVWVLRAGRLGNSQISIVFWKGSEIF